LHDAPKSAPTIIVLGNEGHGIRTNILRRCTHLVRIGGGSGGAASSVYASTVSDIASPLPLASDTVVQPDSSVSAAASTSNYDNDSDNAAISSSSDSDSSLSDPAVDSLNVSVTGAIILHHFLTVK
jgi:hypothetical protein